MSASVSKRQYLVTLMSNFLTHSVHLRRHDAEPFSEPMKTWTYNSNFCTKHAKRQRRKFGGLGWAGIFLAPERRGPEFFKPRLGRVAAFFRAGQGAFLQRSDRGEGW